VRIKKLMGGKPAEIADVGSCLSFHFSRAVRDRKQKESAAKTHDLGLQNGLMRDLRPALVFAVAVYLGGAGEPL
jgi:hypothetical protein